MDFYLITSEFGDLQFPVNPEEVKVITEAMVSTVDINDLGEIDQHTGEKLPVFAFSSFLPKHYDSYCQYQSIPDPNETAEKLDRIRESGKPVRLLISGTPINTLVRITSFVPQVRGGEPGDIYFDIEFRKHKEVKVRKVSVKKKPSPRPSKPKPKTYTVVSGDTLWDIAKRKLGGGSKWPSIYKIPENKKTIGSNPDLIYPGQKLVIP